MDNEISGEEGSTELRPLSVSQSLPLWQSVALFSAVCFVGAILRSFLFDGNSSPTGFFLPAGIYGGVLLLHETRNWRWLMLGALLAHAALALGLQVPLGVSLGAFFASSASAFTGAWLMRRYVVAWPTLGSLKEFAGLLVCLPLLGSAVGALVEALAVRLAAPDSPGLVAWKFWWASSFITSLVAVPFVLVWLGRPSIWPRIRSHAAAKKLEAIALAVGLAVCTRYVLVEGGGIAGQEVGWLVLFIIWAGLRFGTHGVCLVNLVLTVLVCFFTSHYLRGLNAAQVASQTHVFFLQTLLSAFALSGITLAIVLEDRDNQMLSLRKKEQHLREVQWRFQAFMDRTPGVAFIQDETGRFIFENAAWKKHFAPPPASAANQHHDERPPAVKAPPLSAADRLVLANGRAVETVECRTTADGIRRDWLMLKFPLQDIHGSHLLGGFGLDITLAREAERASRLSELRYRRLHENLMDGFIATDLAGHFLETNQALQEMLGYSAAELKGISYQKITPEKWHAFEAQIITRQVETRGFSDVFEKEYRHRHGHVFPVELRLYREMDFDGRPVGYWALVRDISGRVQALRQLEQSERRLSLAIAATSEAIWEWDVLLGEAYFSARWYEILGYPDQHFPMNSAIFRERCHPDDLHFVEERVRAALASNTPVCYDCEFRVRASDGQWRWLLGRGNVVKRNEAGHPLVLSGTCTDITGRKLAELQAETSLRERDRLEAQLRQAQKMEAIGSLAGGIAHDFNNILGAIMAHAELARMAAKDNQPVQASLAQILKSSDRAKELVWQILTFSRQNKVERKVIQLQPVINEVLKLLGSTLPATIEMVANVRSEISPVLADPTQIHQVLINLCTNAAHAMSGRCGQLEICLDQVVVDEVLASSMPDLVPGEFVRLSVRDTGHGMDAKTLSHMFEPFFTTKGPGEGTGLGLAVVHGIVSEHEGIIQVFSQPGVGTRFQVFLPAKLNAVADANHPSPLLPPGAGERVLVVDDELALCDVIASMLNKFNYQVVTCTKPLAALEMLRQKPDFFDLVLLDLAMPGLTGLDLAKEILHLAPSMPVLLTTGYSGGLTVEKIQRLGIRKLIMKPILPSALLQTIREALHPT